MADTQKGRTLTPPPQPPTLKDTPAKPRSIHSSEFRFASLENKRNALLRELDRVVPEYNINQFLEMLPTSNIKFDDITEQLIEKGVITKVQPDAGDSSEFKLAHFPTDPSDSPETENDVFNRLNEDIFVNMVAAVAQRNPEERPTTQLMTEPNTAPNSDRKSRTRPDAHFVLNGKVNGRKCNWVDISCTGEFKKSQSADARDDNVTKMVFNLHHTMTIDPCRRFAFGFTIENTQMRLWFLSRSVLAVSTSFNFIKDPKTFISFFLSMTYARETALGWDETMTRVEGKDWTYEIQHGKKTYRVLGILADYGADVLTGRGTRVYKVQLVKENGDLGDIQVLKDVYMNDDRCPEHEIYKEIMGSVKDPKEREDLDKHLLKPADAWMVTVDGEEDHTVKVMMRNISTVTSKSFRLVAKEEGSSDRERESAGPLMSFEEEPDEKAHLATRGPPRSKIAGRKHYRIVFEQVGTPIWQLTSLSDVFIVLRDSAKVLRILAQHSWVHRDISAGNVYFLGGKGLLGDLEYAKVMGSGGGHEVLTGTLDFMAAEVLGRSYAAVHEPVQPEAELALLTELKSRIPKLVFEHNPGHDVESLFWLAVFMLFFYRDASSPALTEAQKAKRSECRRFVFPDNIHESALNRSKIIFQQQDISELVDWFSDSFKPLIDPLYTLNVGLRRVYTAFENSMVERRNVKIFLAAHHTAVAMFERCIKHSCDITIESYKNRILVTLPDPQPQHAHQPNNQQPPEPNASDQVQIAPKPDNEQTPVLNVGDRKRKLSDPYIENLPNYSDKKLCLASGK